MTTQLERIAEKARKETSLKFTSLAHHVTRELIWECLNHIPENSASGVDGITVKEAKESFESWSHTMTSKVHTQGYHPPVVRRVWIPKPGKTEKRPLGVPCVADRALQRATSTVLSAIYEQDFLTCSLGGRAGRGAHHALATLNEIIAGKKVGWVYEADLKNFFGSLNHDWLLRFVEHRVGDPRMISLIRRWLKSGVLENGKIKFSEDGTPQGGSVSVLLSNIYLHYVLDLWFERVVKPRLRGEAYLVRYIDDFVVCFQYRSDAIRFQEALKRRLGKFSLALEPDKTRLVEFGRFAHRHAKTRAKKMDTIYFLGFTHFCTRNRKGNFMVGRKTENKRFRRALTNLKELMCKIRHRTIEEQTEKINQSLQGHYAYYGIAGNLNALRRVYRFVEWYWRKTLSRRSQDGLVRWEQFHRIKTAHPLRKPKLYLPYSRIQSFAVL